MASADREPPHAASASDEVPEPEEKVRAYRAHLAEAEKGDAKAQHNVGMCFYDGKGVERDLKEAVRWFRKAAKKGIAHAQFFLGFCLMHVEGGRRDADEALVWYRKAAEQGHAGAQYKLGFCLAKGEGVARDAEQAAVWYRKAAEQGDAAAQCNLGAALENGVGVAQDADQAVVWYRKAAEQGCAQAQYNLACCLESGNGVARDVEQAVVWYRKAAEQGHAHAQHNLGVLLLWGAEGMPKDVTAGARFLGAAAQQGQAEALWMLSHIAGDPEVAKTCCLGCGATANLQACSRCHVARFCGKACVVRMWPMHKPHCKGWQAEAMAAAASGSGGLAQTATRAELLEKRPLACNGTLVLAVVVCAVVVATCNTLKLLGCIIAGLVGLGLSARAMGRTVRL